MKKEKENRLMDRRAFMTASTAAAMAGSSLLGAQVAGAENVSESDGLDHRNERPDRMRYRKLGRTSFMCSRLVFGGGAALVAGRGVRLLDRAYEQGVNHYDLGCDDDYKGAEKAFAPFFKEHRDDIWVTSKAPARLLTKEEWTVGASKKSAQLWGKQLDQSLKYLGTDYVDAYYLKNVESATLVKSEELYKVFLDAKKAGKVGHFGISTHKNAQECLEAAVETGWYSLAMIAITPAGWYDWERFQVLEGTPSLKELRPVLDRARGAGIGLIGMKAARHLAPVTSGGKNDQTAFDRYYDEKLLSSSLSAFQRSYAYVLENGLDVANADMQNLKHFEENAVAAKTSNAYFA